jgi:SPW repeat
MLPNKWRNAGWGDAAELLLAAFLFISPWMYGYAATAVAGRDAWICAVVIGLASASAILFYAGWAEWVSLLAGVWVLLSPWLLNFHHTVLPAMRVDVTVGMFVVVIALANLWATRPPPQVPA